MPKISVYVPDDLYAEMKRHDLPVSQVAQRAFADALATDRNAAWIAAARRRPARVTTIDSESLAAAVDEDFGA
ncbi:MAG TPA: hypothetical protein VFN21_03065 [Acidimicrobiales bacterium]|nr:hypothetical protein [Acidimicrobiales bacterium]